MSNQPSNPQDTLAKRYYYGQSKIGGEQWRKALMQDINDSAICLEKLADLSLPVPVALMDHLQVLANLKRANGL